jgi:hypothetical protein
LFHFDRISWIELRWMNRSDHWQNLAWLGELLLTPGSTLTLAKVYHPSRKNRADFVRIRPTLRFLRLKCVDQNQLTASTPCVIG